MADDGTGAPLSRRVPGAARRAPGQSAKPVLSKSALSRMQAAIEAERARATPAPHEDPNTEPLPRVTALGSPGNRGARRRPPSPSGAVPDPVPLPGQAAQPARVAEVAQAPEPPRAEEPLRVAKALHVAEPALLGAVEQEPLGAAEPAPPVPAEPPPPQDRARRTSGAAAPEPGPTPGSIGWLWPEETASGGGGGRRWRPPGRWRYRAATLVILGAGALVGAGLFAGVALHSTPVAGVAHGKSSPRAVAASTPAASPTTAASSPPGTAAPATYVTQAAAWVDQQIDPGTFVACDAQTCAALTAVGFPAGQEVQLDVNSQSLSNASVVVVTPELRTFFSTVNPSLGSEVTPAILASFGQVSIQVIYPGGAVAYQTALSQDVQARVQVGQQLLNSGQVTASPAAESELASGDVDSRVLLALQALASQEPIDILAFGDSGPGASQGIPLRGVQLAESDAASGLSQSAYLQTMAQVLTGHATFPAFQKGGPVTLPDGQTVVQIEYAAPSPLGLLSS